MKKLSILGVLVIIAPFLGFPNSWDNIIYPILGLIILVMSFYFSRKISSIAEKQEKSLKGNVYVENDDSTIQD